MEHRIQKIPGKFVAAVTVLILLLGGCAGQTTEMQKDAPQSNTSTSSAVSADSSMAAGAAVESTLSKKKDEVNTFFGAYLPEGGLFEVVHSSDAQLSLENWAAAFGVDPENYTLEEIG